MGQGMRKLAVLFVASVLVTLSVAGCLGQQPRGYNVSDLVAPESFQTAAIAGVTPTPSTAISPGYSVSINWTWTDVYAEYGNVMELRLTNTGSTLLTIYGYGLKWNDSAVEYWRNCSTAVESGRVADLGKLGFDGPPAAGEFFYHILVKVAAYSPSAHAWHDYGARDLTTRLTDVLPLKQDRSYGVASNSNEYYDKVNNLLNFSAVQPVADLARSATTSFYSVAQIAYVFDWARENIQYTDDPNDIWQSSADTMALRTGDCEDYAILVAAVVHDLGGDARVNVIEEHAFATVYIGSNASCIDGVRSSLDSYYGTSLKLAWLQDDTGYWLVVDPTALFAAGTLPTLASPTYLDGSRDAWTFDSTTFLSHVDAVGPSSTSGRVLPWF
jgi:hypothetical protein